MKSLKWFFASLLAFLWTAVPAAAAEKEGPLTFTKDIAPIIFKHCASCHRPGEVAPFSLLTYRDVKKRATLISEAVRGRLMPPWKAVPGHGEFRGARRLTNEDIGRLARWAKEGAIEGEAKHLPPAPKFPTGWQLGKPDLLVTMPKAYPVPASGPDVYRNFAIPIKVPEGKYIRAMEFKPGNRRVVHHAILAFDPTGQVRLRDGRDGAPGFSQSNIPGQMLPGNMAFWVPGKDPRPLPDGVAMSWPKGADFVLQLHLHPSGKEEVEQSTVAFYFTSTAPRRSLGNFAINCKKINIPPGSKDHRVKETKTLSADVEVHGIFPHMHLIGKEIKATAILPDGTKKSLLRIDKWDFNWQNYYEYQSPVSLPKGTQVVMECTYDNSADNPSNPNQPPRRVVYGEQTNNEMAIVLLHVLHKGTQANPGDITPDFRAQAKDLLRRFDTDKDGKLSAEELGRIPAAKGKDIAGIIKRFDKDGDGKLDEKEIIEALKALRKR